MASSSVLESYQLISLAQQLDPMVTVVAAAQHTLSSFALYELCLRIHDDHPVPNVGVVVQKILSDSSYVPVRIFSDGYNTTNQTIFEFGNVRFSTFRRGLCVVTFLSRQVSPLNSVLYARTVSCYDTCACENDRIESDDFADAIESLPKGTLVAVAVKDEASYKLNERAKAALESLGSTKIRTLGWRHGYAFVGVAGAEGKDADLIHEKISHAAVDLNFKIKANRVLFPEDHATFPRFSMNDPLRFAAGDSTPYLMGCAPNFPGGPGLTIAAIVPVTEKESDDANKASLRNYREKVECTRFVLKPAGPEHPFSDFPKYVNQLPSGTAVAVNFHYVAPTVLSPEDTTAVSQVKQTLHDAFGSSLALNFKKVSPFSSPVLVLVGKKSNKGEVNSPTAEVSNTHGSVEVCTALAKEADCEFEAAAMKATVTLCSQVDLDVHRPCPDAVFGSISGPNFGLRSRVGVVVAVWNNQGNKTEATLMPPAGVAKKAGSSGSMKQGDEEEGDEEDNTSSFPIRLGFPLTNNHDCHVLAKFFKALPEHVPVAVVCCDNTTKHKFLSNLFKEDLKELGATEEVLGNSPHTRSYCLFGMKGTRSRKALESNEINGKIVIENPSSFFA